MLEHCCGIARALLGSLRLNPPTFRPSFLALTGELSHILMDLQQSLLVQSAPFTWSPRGEDPGSDSRPLLVRHPSPPGESFIIVRDRTRRRGLPCHAQEQEERTEFFSRHGLNERIAGESIDLNWQK